MPSQTQTPEPRHATINSVKAVKDMSAHTQCYLTRGIKRNRFTHSLDKIPNADENAATQAQQIFPVELVIHQIYNNNIGKQAGVSSTKFCKSSKSNWQ